MSKLGTKKKPAVVTVQTQEKAQEIMSMCNKNGWQVIVGIEPHSPERIDDFERLMNPIAPQRAVPKVGRNEPCPCGSDKKYKKCCGK